MDVYAEEYHSCYFNMNNSKWHPMYYETGYRVQEYEVYNENGLLSSIADKIPRYKSSDLKLNYYKLYQKPYSFWSDECQALHTTEEAAEVGSTTGDAAYYMYIIFVATLMLFIGEFMLLILAPSCVSCKIFKVFMIFSQIWTYGMNIVLLIAYAAALYNFNKVDKIKLQSFVDNKCSDTVLQYAFEKFNSDYVEDIVELIIGICFLVVGIILQILTSICLCSTSFASFANLRIFCCLKNYSGGVHLGKLSDASLAPQADYTGNVPSSTDVTA